MRLEVGEWGYVGISVVVAHKYSGTNTARMGRATPTHGHTHTRAKWAEPTTA